MRFSLNHHNAYLKVIRARSQVISMGGELKFSCKRQLGAVLLIDRPAERKDVMFSIDLKQYTATNCQSWLRFARDTLRRDLQLKDLLLVTGRDLASRWAMATFFDRTFEGDISFKVGQSGLAEIRGGLMGSWSSVIGIPARCGPVDRASLVLDASKTQDWELLFQPASTTHASGFHFTTRTLNG